jgi:hypothetical protein
MFGIRRHAAAVFAGVFHGRQPFFTNLIGRRSAEFAFDFFLRRMTESFGTMGGRATVLTCIGHCRSPSIELDDWSVSSINRIASATASCTVTSHHRVHPEKQPWNGGRQPWQPGKPTEKLSGLFTVVNIRQRKTPN